MNNIIKDNMLSSCMETLGMLGINVEESSKSVVNDSDSVFINVKFTGDIVKNVVINTGTEMGCQIANIMLGGMCTVTDIDDMAKSVLGELANMICGSLSTRLSNLGYTSDITPPIVLKASESDIEIDSSNIISLVNNGNIINTCAMPV